MTVSDRRMRITGWLLLALAAVALAAPPRAGAVSTSNKCLVWAAKYKLAEQSKFALVFSKDNPHVNSAGPVYYGCVFSTQVARVLPGQGEGATLSQFTLAGRYVGYAKKFHDQAVAESGGLIMVFDAKQGGTKVSQPAWPDQAGVPPENRGFSDEVTSLVLKTNGSVAWIGHKFNAGSSDPGTYSVQRVSATDGVKQELDRGAAIGAQSLALARDNLTIYWSNGAVVKSAQLP